MNSTLTKMTDISGTCGNRSEWNGLTYTSKSDVRHQNAFQSGKFFLSAHSNVSCGSSYSRSNDCHHVADISQSKPAENDSFSCSSSNLSVPASNVNFNCHKILSGRRIVDIDYFFKEIFRIGVHGDKSGCSLCDVNFCEEVCQGFRSGFVFKCNKCNSSFILWSEPERREGMDINTAAVWSITRTGGGFTSLHQLMSGMDVRCMSAKSYNRYEAALPQIADADLKEIKTEEIEAEQEADVDMLSEHQLNTDGLWAEVSRFSTVDKAEDFFAKDVKIVEPKFDALDIVDIQNDEEGYEKSSEAHKVNKVVQCGDQTSSDEFDQPSDNIDIGNLKCEKSQNRYDDVDSQSISTLKQSCKTTAKRSKRKKHYCKFCLKLIAHFSRHLLKMHYSEEEVARYKTMQTLSQKIRCLQKIMAEGDDIYNKNNPLKQIVYKRSKNPNSVYSKCPNCKMLISNNHIVEHVRKCKLD